jgi:hypothetical protein
MNNLLNNNFGEQVYVTGAHPNGLTLKEYHALTERQRRQHTWRPMVRGWPARNLLQSAAGRSKARAGD